MDKCKIYQISKDTNYHFCAEEKETVINFDDVSNSFSIFTRQQSMFTKMDKLGVEPCKKGMIGDRMAEAEYNLPNDEYYIIFKKRIKHTEEEKEEMGRILKERLANKNQKNYTGETEESEMQ